METDLKDVIKQKTEFKAPTGFNVADIDIKDSDFVDAPYIPDDNKPDLPGFTSPVQNPDVKTDVNKVNAPDIKPEKVFDPDFTTDIVIDTCDTIQHTAFLALNQKKQKGKRFKNRDEYLEAVKLSYLTNAEIEKLENPEEKKVLVEKLKTLTEVMSKINKELQLTPEEKQRLRKPVYELVKRNNFDVPPGLALVLVSIDIISSRVIDLIMD